MGSVGLNRYQTQRQGYGGYAAGTTGGAEVTGQLGGGYDWNLGKAQAGIFASGQYTYVGIDGFDETGSLAPLGFSAQGETSVLSDLGVKAGRRWTVGEMALRPGVSLAWEHWYQGASDSLNAGLPGGGNFTVAGPNPWTDGLVVGAGLDARFAGTLSLSFQYQDRLGLGKGGSQSFSGGVNFGF
jgi:outer membrane autotransporter protein